MSAIVLHLVRSRIGSAFQCGSHACFISCAMQAGGRLGLRGCLVACTASLLHWEKRACHSLRFSSYTLRAQAAMRWFMRLTASSCITWVRRSLPRTR